MYKKNTRSAPNDILRQHFLQKGAVFFSTILHISVCSTRRRSLLTNALQCLRSEIFSHTARLISPQFMVNMLNLD